MKSFGVFLTFAIVSESSSSSGFPSCLTTILAGLIFRFCGAIVLASSTSAKIYSRSRSVSLLLERTLPVDLPKSLQDYEEDHARR